MRRDRDERGLTLVELLVAMGYGGSLADAGQALGKTGDNGVDGILWQQTCPPPLLCYAANHRHPWTREHRAESHCFSDRWNACARSFSLGGSAERGAGPIGERAHHSAGGCPAGSSRRLADL